jgi:hypothetical protein
VGDAPVDIAQATPSTGDAGDDLVEDTLKAPADLTPQVLDVGWFELDENVLKGMT